MTGYAACAAASAAPNFFYVLLAFDIPVRRAVEPFVQPLAAGAAMAVAIKWRQASSAALTSPLLQVGRAGAIGVVAYALAWMDFALLTLDL